MIGGVRCAVLVIAVGALLAGAARARAVGEYADVYLLDGRHFFGKIIEEDPNKIVLEYRHGAIVVNMTFGANEIDRIDRQQIEATIDPALTDPLDDEEAGGDEDDAWPDEQGALAEGAGGYAIVPVRGTVGEELTAGFFDAAMREADRAGAEAVIFHVDSPGGMVVELDRIRTALDRHEADGHRVAFYVDEEAFSAAALLCLSSEHFFVGEGARVGAAVAFRWGTGSAEVDAKFTAAFAATWRSRAERAGREPAIVDAMIDMSKELWADTRTEPWTVSAEGPQRERRRGRRRERDRSEEKDGDGGAGDDDPWVQIDDDEHVLALTHTEALNIGAADGLFPTARAAAADLDLDSPQREAFDGERFSERYFRSHRTNMERARRAVRDAREAASMLGASENRVELKNRLREVMANLNRAITLYERYDYIRNYIDSQGYSVRRFEDVVRRIRRFLGRE